MLRHVVLFSWKEDTPPAKVAEFEAAFAELPAKIKEIHDFEWGTNVSIEGLAQGFSHCFLVTFKSEEDRSVYLPHPAHQAFGELIRPYKKDVLVIDYWQ